MATDINAQTPGQNAVNPGAQPPTTPQNQATLGIMNDPVAAAIHDAFLLGSSLVQLKSRVKIAMLNVQAAADVRHASQGGASQGGASPAPTGDPLRQALTRVEALLTDVKQLTQGAVAELLPSQSNDGTELTSEWRALFSRIASLQNKRFSNSSTIGTAYEPPPQGSLKYLYPTPDYASVGVSNTVDKLGNFHLYDVTRRALNCLTLLYTSPAASLIPDVVGSYRSELVQHILNPTDQNKTAQANVVAEDVQAAGSQLNGTNEVNTEQPSQDDVDQVIKILSGFVIGYLEAWDGYVRENYYIGGGLTDNELELIAYSAGCSIAELCWSVDLRVAPLENALQFSSKNGGHAASQGQGLAQAEGQNAAGSQNAMRPDPEVLKTRLYTEWTKIFNDGDINRIQHQISALKTALDDAYYRAIKQGQPPADGAVLVRPDLQLPSNALHAVEHSLDYWQMGVSWISENVRPKQNQAGGASLGGASLGGASPAPTKVGFQMWEPWEWSQTLRLALIQQAGVWQSLVLCQQSLHSFAVQSVTQRILSNFMQTFQQVAVQGLIASAKGVADETAAVEKQVKSDIASHYGPILIAVLIPIVVILAVLIALVLLLPNLGADLKGSFAGLLALTGSAIVYTGARLRQTITGVPGEQAAASQASSDARAAAVGANTMFDHFSTVLGSAGSAITAAFEHGFEQIQIEFDYLNHNVSVAFPLIEFLTLNPDKFKEEISDGYTFLTKIVWTTTEREAELQRVAQAAFGPIGAFVGTHLELQKPTGPGSATSKPSPKV